MDSVPSSPRRASPNADPRDTGPLTLPTPTPGNRQALPPHPSPASAASVNGCAESAAPSLVSPRPALSRSHAPYASSTSSLVRSPGWERQLKVREGHVTGESVSAPDYRGQSLSECSPLPFLPRTQVPPYPAHLHVHVHLMPP